MIVYWAACFASTLTAYVGLNRFTGKKQIRAVLFFTALPMILVAALRYDVGQDYLPTYVSYFETVRTGFSMDYSRMEPIYHLMNLVVAKLGGDYVWVFAVCAVIFYVTVIAQIFDESPYPAFSVYLLTGMGFCFVFFNAMRQMVGCGILLYSLRYIQKRNLWKFLICVGLASCFHYSCAVFVAMYWVGRIRIRPYMAFLLTGAVVLLSQFIVSIVKRFISFTQYAVYFSSVFDDGKTAVVMLAMNAVLLVFDSYLYRDKPKYILYYNLQMLALWVTIFSGKIVLMLRMLWVFGLPSVISLPMAVAELPEKKERKFMLAIIGLLYFIYILYTVGVQNGNSVLPYRTILSR